MYIPVGNDFLHREEPADLLASPKTGPKDIKVYHCSV